MSEKPHTLHRIIDDNWIEIASFAWRSFEESGRGAVFIDLNRMEVTEGGLRLPELEYLHPSDRLSGLADAFDLENGRNLVGALVANYVPYKNLVCVILEPDGSVYARNGMNPFLSPPEAAARAS